MRQDLPQPRYAELFVIVGLGAAHVIIEVAFSLGAARIYNATALTIGFAYLTRRVLRSKDLLHRWGLRTDNFWAAFRSQLPFFGIALAVLALWGAASGRLRLPPTLWIVLLLYPFFGIAQQFVLQNLLAANLRGLVRQPVLCALAAALLFGLSHLPRVELCALGFIAGFFLTLVYQRHPNLWTVGMTHGLLAALVFYFVLGEDPGLRILESLRTVAGVGSDGAL